jgi:hypothetical protein
VIGLATSSDLSCWNYQRIVLKEPFHRAAQRWRPGKQTSRLFSACRYRLQVASKKETRTLMSVYH